MENLINSRIKIKWIYHAITLLSVISVEGQDDSNREFRWPGGIQAALSLTFDDARLSQVDIGTPLFDKYDVKATFYVVPSRIEPRIEAWKEAVKNGHEIGNHSLHHPCTGNFEWIRDFALENFTLEGMRKELVTANTQVKELLGITPVSFAYPCGQKFVNKGVDTKSYVPLVAELFESGRGWLDEASNVPGYLDFAQLLGQEMDGKDFEEIKLIIEKAKAKGSWVVLAGHEIGTDGAQTTTVSMLEKLIEYAQDPENGIWLAPVGTISEYLNEFNFTASGGQIAKNKNELSRALSFFASFDGHYEADFAQGSKEIFTAPSYRKLHNATKGMNTEHISIAARAGKYNDALEFKHAGTPVIFYNAEKNINYHSRDWSGTISLWLSLRPDHDLPPKYSDPIQITDVSYEDAALWVDFTDKNPREFRMGIFGDLNVWNPDKIGPDINPKFKDRLVTAVDAQFHRRRWTHVVISFSNLNTSKATADFYVNGKLQGSVNDISEPFTWDTSKAKIIIGLNYIGLVDDLAIFKRGLSEHEVQFLYRLHHGITSIIPKDY